MSAQPQVPPTVALVQIASAALLSRALWVVADRRVADQLADGPAAADDVAAAVGLHPDALLRLLRALAMVGIFAETDVPGTFVNTPPSEALISDHPLAGRDAVLSMVGSPSWDALSHLQHAAATGESAVRAAFGTSLWEYYDAHPQESAQFNRMMSVMNAGEPAAVAAAYDFSGMALVVDVGGGIGTLLGTVLAAHPHLRGILVDRADVVAQAEAELQRLGVAERCERRAQDFREAVPEGADAYLLSHIVHDWDAESARALLERCGRAAAPGGRVLVVEMVLPDRNAPHPGKVLDIAMLAMPGGRERTHREYAALLEAAGLELERVIPTQSASSIVVGRRSAS